MGSQAPVGGFYRRLPGGRIVCRLCQAADHAHAPGCPVTTLDAQVRALTGQLGLFVATIRETTEALARLLRGEGGDGTDDAP